MIDELDDCEDGFEISDYIDDPNIGEDFYDLDKSPYIKGIKKQAIECMDLFFVDKKYWAGGAISKKKLYNDQNIMTVMQTNILDAFAVAYECLEMQKPQSYNIKGKGWEIQLCYNIIKECSRKYIPKCCAGGILLVYLSLCQGVEYLQVLKQSNSNVLLHGKYTITI